MIPGLVFAACIMCSQWSLDICSPRDDAALMPNRAERQGLGTVAVLMPSWYVILAAGVYSSVYASLLSMNASQKGSWQTARVFSMPSIKHRVSMANSLAALSMPVARCATPYPMHRSKPVLSYHVRMQTMH